MNEKLYLAEDPVHMYILSKLLSSERELTFFDVGACDGLDTVRYKIKYPRAKIHAFEPLERNFGLFERNARDHDGIVLNKFALSDSIGFFDFFESEEDNATAEWDRGNKSSSLLPPKEHLTVFNFINFKTPVKIQTDTLSHYCQLNQVEKIDFIHMDVQGAELMVLRGAKEMLKNVGLIFLEVANVEFYKGQPFSKDIERYMESFGFERILNTMVTDLGEHLYVNWDYFQFSRTERIKLKIAFSYHASVSRELTDDKLKNSIGVRNAWKNLAKEIRLYFFKKLR